MKKRTRVTYLPFLPDVTKEDLRKMLKKEKHPKARARLQAYIMRKDGKALHEIGAKLERPPVTIRRWMKRVRDEHLNGLYDLPIPGAPCKLGDEELAQFRKDLDAGPRACGIDAPVWTVRSVIDHARKKFDVNYSTQGMYILLRRIGFSLRRQFRFLDAKQLEQFRKELRAGPRACGIDAPVWTVPRLLIHVEHKYGLKYTNRKMYYILRRLDFSLRNQLRGEARARPKTASKKTRKK